MANRSFRLELRTPRLRQWLEQRLGQIVMRVRGDGAGRSRWQADIERLGDEVQRFGGAAWQRIVARWPALGELVRDRKLVSVRYRPPPTAAAAPVAPAASLDTSAIEALIAQLLAASAWQARASAALSLAHVEGDGVVPALVRALRDASVEVAVAAVDGLGGRDDAIALRALRGVLENADGYFNPVTRVAAITALARQFGARVTDGGARDSEAVFAAVRDIDAEVSIAAIAVIADGIPDAAAAQLFPLLRDTSGYYLPIVRLAAANALERAGCLHSVIVGELLQHETDASVRRVLERAQYLAADSAQNPASA